MLPLVASALASDPPTLDEARWTHRLVVVVAQDAADARVEQIARTFLERREGVQDRKLRLVTLLDGSVEGLDASPASVRQAWSIAPDTGYEALLVGLDGGVKARTTDAVDLDAWFARIDAMPMRAAELRERDATR
jgi:hypothetical protein